MSFLSLPFEIIRMIAFELPCDADVLDLICTNRLLHDLLIRDLYKRNLDTDPRGFALYWCVSSCAMKGMKHLLSWKADLNRTLFLKEEKNGQITKSQESSALCLAVESDNLLMADFLLKHGADVNAEFKTLSMGEWSPALPTVTPLDLAVGRGNSVMTLLLLQNGAKMRDGITLSRAIEHGAILAWINTESPGYWDDDGFEAPGVAPKYDFRTVVEVLNLYGADINQDCLLHYAVECYGSLDDGVIEHLLFLGANVHAKDSSGFSVISYAFEAEENTTQRIKAFVELLQLYGAKVDPEELHGPLQNAILSRDLEYLELVLDYGADVNFLYDGGTYLHLAITHLAYDVDDTIQEKFVKALLNRGADVLLRNTESKTPLELAMSFSWKKNIAKLLLDAGAKVQCQGKEGTRLLNCLIVDDLAGRFYPDTNRLQYYLEAMETDPSEFESHHDFSDVDDMIGLLLEYGARPDYVDDSGQCPLDQQGAKLFSALHPWLSKRKGA